MSEQILVHAHAEHLGINVMFHHAQHSGGLAICNSVEEFVDLGGGFGFLPDRPRVLQSV